MENLMYIADLHIHSRYSMATSRDCTPEYLDLWAKRKGIHLVGTGDFTHPAWRQELREKLELTEDVGKLFKECEPEDLVHFGLIPELIGRLPVITYLDHLDRDALKRILTEPKNALMKQYEKMFELDGIALKVDPEVLDLIVDTSIENRLGARGLRSICEKIMTDAMYDAPTSGKKTFRLTLRYAKEKLQ